MTESSPPAGDRPAQQQTPAAGISRLARMSTTAGVGLQEYRAINPFAVASVVLGAASLLVWLHPLLYVLPALGLLFGGVALWQISHSNRTQSGTVLAGIGLVLSAGFAGAILVNEARWHAEVTRYRDEIQETFEQFGAALARHDFDAAYSMMTEGFMSEIDRPTFESQLSQLMAAFGPVESAGSNRLAEVTRDDAGRVTAQAMLIVHFVDLEEPQRQPVRMTRTPEGWRLQQLPIWFPHPTRPQGG